MSNVVGMMGVDAVLRRRAACLAGVTLRGRGGVVAAIAVRGTLANRKGAHCDPQGLVLVLHSNGRQSRELLVRAPARIRPPQNSPLLGARNPTGSRMRSSIRMREWPLAPGADSGRTRPAFTRTSDRPGGLQATASEWHPASHPTQGPLAPNNSSIPWQAGDQPRDIDNDVMVLVGDQDWICRSRPSRCYCIR